MKKLNDGSLIHFEDGFGGLRLPEYVDPDYPDYYHYDPPATNSAPVECLEDPSDVVFWPNIDL